MNVGGPLPALGGVRMSIRQSQTLRPSVDWD